MEYYYYNSTTKEFAFHKNRELDLEGFSSTTVASPVCDHGDEYPNYIEKAVFDEESNTWTKVAI